MFKSVVLAGQLETKRGELKALFDSYKGADGVLNVPADKIEEIEKRNDEIKSINDEYLAAKKLEDAVADNDSELKGLRKVVRPNFAAPEGEKTEAKSFGDLVIAAGALKSWQQPVEVDLSVKTVMSTGAGFAPFSPRDNVVADYPLRKLGLLDVIPQMDWNYASYLFMEETTHTNNAAEKAESANGALVAYGEAAFAFTERSITMRDIGTFLPVSEQQLEDVPGMVSLLNGRLSYQVRNRLEAQLIAGDGNAPNIGGILNVSGIQSQAKGSDSVPDAIYKAITKVRSVGFTEPTHILMHPNDFQDIRILQNTTGQYVFEGGMNQAGVPMLFGLPVILSTAVTENTAIVLDISFFQAVNRRGVIVESTWMGDDFKNGVKSIRATVRGNLACYRGKAACKVTGI